MSRLTPQARWMCRQFKYQWQVDRFFSEYENDYGTEAKDELMAVYLPLKRKWDALSDVEKQAEIVRDQEALKADLARCEALQEETA